MRKEAEKRKAEAIESLRVRVRVRDNRVKFCFAFWPFESLLNSFNFVLFTVLSLCGWVCAS